MDSNTEYFKSLEIHKSLYPLPLAALKNDHKLTLCMLCIDTSAEASPSCLAWPETALMSSSA